MKNWQLRWFVLKTDQLYFYKDEDETKPQVSFISTLIIDPKPENTCIFFFTLHILMPKERSVQRLLVVKEKVIYEIYLCIYEKQSTISNFLVA